MMPITRLIASRRPHAAAAAVLDRCPMCASGDVAGLHGCTFRERRWTLARCRDCGLHFTSPRPTDADLYSFYQGEYHRNLCVPGATEAKFGAKYARYVDTLGRHLQSGRVLDIGCTTGLLVRMLRDRGYEAEGVELDERSAQWGRAHYGVPIRVKPIEQCGFEPGSLDAVLMTDVLEHTRHPRDFLRELGRLLRPAGLVLVTFPDIRSIESRYLQLLSRLLRREWIWSCCHIPLHVWEFTPRTAVACFESAGFRVAEFRRSQPRYDAGDSPRVVRAITQPTRLLGLPGMGRLLGTQMEFVLEKKA